MKPIVIRLLGGGLVATVAMTLMMHFVAPIMTGQAMDIAARIAGMLGMPYLVGVGIHFINGVVLFPLAYALFAFSRIPGPPVVRGTLFGIVLWLLAATIVMPLTGAGFLMANIGGMKAVVAALVGHVVYGALLGAIATRPRSRAEVS